MSDILNEIGIVFVPVDLNWLLKALGFIAIIRVHTKDALKPPEIVDVRIFVETKKANTFTPYVPLCYLVLVYQLSHLANAFQIRERGAWCENTRFCL